MQQTIINNIPIAIQPLKPDMFEALVTYYSCLSAETKNRFAPHAFTMEALENLFVKNNIYTAFIGSNMQDNSIIAYTIIKIGYLPDERERLNQWGLKVDIETDATLAPSVSDIWQSVGIGQLLFNYTINHLQNTSISRLLLWGGVQCLNEKAVKFYLKNNFKIAGEFDYNGCNYDMYKNLRTNY